MTKKDILNLLSQYKQELQSNYSVEKIGLFGSYAKDTATESSDVDIYVEFRDKKFKNIAKTWNFLEEKIGKRIDLLYNHKNMRESLKNSIKKDIIYG